MVTKSLNPNAVASATSITFQQKTQSTGAFARNEKILVIGSPNDSKELPENTIKQFSSSNDVAIAYGFGSPLHRMAIKLFPEDGNGSKVETYFTSIDGNGTNHKIKVNVLGKPNKNFTGYLRFKELVFEAPADVVGKIATAYQLNPAKAPRKMDLNIFNKVKIPFTILKDSIETEILNSIKEIIEEYVEVPFIADTITETIKKTETIIDPETEEETSTEIETTETYFALISKWKGETAKFEIDFVDNNNEIITAENYGIAFTTEIKEEASGLVNIKPILDSITEQHEFTRIVCQFNDELNLDRLKDKCLSFRDGLICQYILAYTGKLFKESKLVKGTVDIEELKTFGNSRRDDSVNVIIAGTYNNELRLLTYNERDSLLKAGISNLEPNISTNSYRIGDLITLYHPEGQKNPLFRYDRDITLLGNIGYDLMAVFRNSDSWKSIIIVSENLITNNDAARTIKDVKAELDTRLRLYGKNAWIADVEQAINDSIVQLDDTNPNRFNINPNFELSGVGRVYDITNFVGFYFGTTE